MSSAVIPPAPVRHTPLDIIALGARIRLVFDDDLHSSTVDAVRDSWEGARVPFDPAIRPDRTVAVTAEREPDILAEALTVEVTHAALTVHRGELFLFHACGVADAAGRVAAFVGPSGAGKTTLSRTLARAYGYVSDETIALDTTLVVLPYRKPLSIVRERRPKEQLAPTDAGLQPAPDISLSLSALVLIARDPELREPTIEQVPFAEAVIELCPQMSYFAELPAPLQTLAALCNRIGGVTRLAYPDASTVTPIVPQLLDHARVHEEWQQATVVNANADFDLSGVVDAVHSGGYLVVLAQRRVHVLDGIAPAIWDSLRAGRDVDGIVDDVVAVFGPPEHGDPRVLVEAALGDLADIGVLRRRH